MKSTGKQDKAQRGTGEKVKPSKPLQQSGHSDEHANSERLGSNASACDRQMLWTSSCNLVQTSLVRLMGIASAGRFVGNPL